MGLALDELKNDQPVYTINDIQLLIEDSILSYTRDRQINYVDNEYGRGFSIGSTGISGC